MECLIGTIIPWAPNYPPQGWIFCTGQLLPIQQYTALFSILGITYGGDGRTNFALPNLCGRTMMGFDQNHPLGQTAGTETVTLTAAQMANHNHSIKGNTSTAVSGSNIPDNTRVIGVATVGTTRPVSTPMYNTYSGNPGDLTAFNAAEVGLNGGGGAHENMQPYLGLNYIICTDGMYPVRS